MYTDTNQHVLEPELAGPVPRAAQFTPMTKFTRALGLTIWIAVTIGLFYGAYRDISTLQRLVTTGKTMYATVTDHYAHYGKSTSYHLDYAYTLDGAAYGNSVSVTRNFYEETQIGSHLLITYLPSDPAIVRVGTVNQPLIHSHTQNWVIGIGLVCTILGIIFAIIEGNYKKRMFLMRYGTAAIGRITGSAQSHNKKTTSYTVSYSFSADGQPMWQTVLVPSQFYFSVFSGAFITILYVPDNPIDSLPYKAIAEVEIPQPHRIA